MIPSYEVEASVNVTVNGLGPVVGMPEKSAIGSASATDAVVVFVSVAASSSVTVSVTVYVPSSV